MSIDKDMSADEQRKKLDSMQRRNKKMLKGKEPDWEAIKQPKGNIALRAFEEI